MPVAFFPSCPPLAPNPRFSQSYMTFGKESTDVPVIITLMRADKCLAGTREEPVLNLRALFSNTLFSVMRSRGFYTDMRS